MKNIVYFFFLESFFGKKVLLFDSFKILIALHNVKLIFEFLLKWLIFRYLFANFLVCENLNTGILVFDLC